MDDLAVICRIRRGDRGGFAVLLDRYRTDVFALTRAMLVDRDEAEDAAHDAFVAAFERLDSFDPSRGAFRPWLLRIARNGCLNRRKRRRSVALAFDPAGGRRPDEVLESDEAFRRLDAALAALPVHQRTAFVLAEVEGLAHAEIAAIEGIAVGTVKSRVGRARTALRSALTPREGETR